MGLDLKLLPFYNGDADFSNSVLSLHRHNKLFEEILKIQTYPVPEDFMSYVSRSDEYEEEHFGITNETPFGDTLEYCFSKDLWHLLEIANQSGNWLNSVVWSYLLHMPSETKIALYWC